MDVVCFLLGNSPVSDLYMLTFRNTLSVPSSHLPMKMEQTECSEMSAYINQTPGNYPKENTLYSEHGESLKSRKHMDVLLILCYLAYVISVTAFVFITEVDLYDIYIGLVLVYICFIL